MPQADSLGRASRGPAGKNYLRAKAFVYIHENVRVLAMLCCAVTLQGQSRVVGTIRDAAGRALPQVAVTLTGRDGTIRSDSTGAFLVRDVAAGGYQLTAQRLGFAPDSIDIHVGERDAVYVSIVMEPIAASLKAVTVVARRQMLPRVYERIDKGHGAALFAEDIPQYRVGSVDDLLKFAPQFSSRIFTHLRCGRPLVFLDGKRIPPPIFTKDPPPAHKDPRDFWPPLSFFVSLKHVEAIEVHASPDFLKEPFLINGVGDVHLPELRSIGPIQLGYNPPKMGGLDAASCQRVVMIWSKGYKMERISGAKDS